MDVFSVLEQKIRLLVEERQKLLQQVQEVEALLNRTADEKEAVAQECALLKEQNEKLEAGLLQAVQKGEEFDQERQLTKMVIDDLIQSIDGIVAKENF